VTAEALEDTAFGQTSRTMTAGLFSNSLTLTVYASYAASESYAVLAPLLGTKCTIKVNPTSAADSATNPGFILTDTYFSSLPVVNASLGELSVYEIELQGGTYSVDTTA
jgi:LDH2 family malate/lactate/ureidoglycolate dehydrogenase